MNKFLHLAPERLRDIYAETQAKTNLPEQSIEKDFWVCWTLRELFGLPGWENRLTFKGGTSLSKAFGLIDRFSEDIDVVIDREFLGFGGELSGKKQKKLREACSYHIDTVMRPALIARLGPLLPAGSAWSVEMASKEEDRDQQTLLFKYPSIFPKPAENLRPMVKIEMGARSQTEPAEQAKIHSYVATHFPQLFETPNFSVRTIAARRTFWDKVMLLHEETYRPPPEKDAPLRKDGLSRHYYDVHRLIERGVAKEALDDKELFAQVLQHRQNYFGYSWMDYATIAPGSLRLLPLEQQADAWRKDYASMQKNLFPGDPPNFDAILKSVESFAQKFNGK